MHVAQKWSRFWERDMHENKYLERGIAAAARRGLLSFFLLLTRRTKNGVCAASDGRVAQRESTALTLQGSQVQSLSRPPSNLRLPVSRTQLRLRRRAT